MQKRTLLIVCTFLLVSCTRHGALQPPEVLQKSFEANQNLESARFDLDTAFKGQTELMSGEFNGTLQANGTMQNGGKQISTDADIRVSRMDPNDQLNTLTLRGSMIVAAENEVYVHVDAASIEPKTELLSDELIGKILNQWFLLAAGSGSLRTDDTVTADPSLLRMQSKVVKVTKDNGLETLNKKSAYYYDVTIDPALFAQYMSSLPQQKNTTFPSATDFLTMSAKGKLWIDEETFFIHRIVWDITSTDPKHPSTVHIDITFADQNAVDSPIAPPPSFSTFPTLRSSEVPVTSSSASSL